MRTMSRIWKRRALNLVKLDSERKFSVQLIKDRGLPNQAVRLEIPALGKLTQELRRSKRTATRSPLSLRNMDRQLRRQQPRFEKRTMMVKFEKALPGNSKAQ